MDEGKKVRVWLGVVAFQVMLVHCLEMLGDKDAAVHSLFVAIPLLVAGFRRLDRTPG